MEIESIHEVSSASFSSRWSVVWDPVGGFSDWSVRGKDHLDFSALPTLPVALQLPSAYVAYNSHFGNHYHMILEWVAAIIDYHELDLGSRYEFILLPESHRGSTALTSILRFLGLEGRVRWLSDSSGTVVGVEALAYPRVLEGLSDHSRNPARLATYRRWGRWECADLKGLSLPRIYVSRLDSGLRVLDNESEVIRYVTSRWNFVALTLGNLPLAHQIALFTGASAVVAPHGAGLANLVFSDPERSRSVVEMRPREYPNVCFERLSKWLNQTHHVLEGSATNADEVTHQHFLRYTVDMQTLGDLLAEIAE